MKREELNQRLSKISTVWTWLRQAHDGRTEAGTEAQQLLLERYGGAVYRYLLRAVGDADTAEQLGKSFTPEGIRQSLRRARQLFVELLLHEVAHSISDPTSEQVERELDELSLLEYGRPLLSRDGRKRT